MTRLERRWLTIVQAGLHAAVAQVEFLLEEPDTPERPGEAVPLQAIAEAIGAAAGRGIAVASGQARVANPKLVNPTPPVADPKPVNGEVLRQKTPERVELLRELWPQANVPVAEVLRRLNALPGAPISDVDKLVIYVTQWGVHTTGRLTARANMARALIAPNPERPTPPKPPPAPPAADEPDDGPDYNLDDADDPDDELAYLRRPYHPAPLPAGEPVIQVRSRDIASWAQQVGLQFNGSNLDFINKARRKRALPIYAPPTS